MLQIATLEDKIEVNRRKLNELLLRAENLDNETQEFLQELAVTPLQLTTFIANENHFTENNWKDLQQVRQKLDDNLQLALNQVRNPKEAQKAYSDRHINPNWIYVR